MKTKILFIARSACATTPKLEVTVTLKVTVRIGNDVENIFMFAVLIYVCVIMQKSQKMQKHRFASWLTC